MLADFLFRHGLHGLRRLKAMLYIDIDNKSVQSVPKQEIISVFSVLAQLPFSGCKGTK